MDKGRKFAVKVFMALSYVLILLSCSQPQLPAETNTNSIKPVNTAVKLVEGDTPDPVGLLQTIQLLTDSLRTNDKQQLRTIVAEESWTQIDTWLTNHTPILCGFSLKNLLEQPDLTIFPSPIPDKTDLWGVHVIQVFSCPTNKGSSYNLIIDQTIVKYTGQKWLVMDWQGVDEKNE